MRNKYTNGMIEFLQENKINTNKHLIELFFNKFNILLKGSDLTNIRYRYNLQSGLKGGQFEKGNVPHNKGKKQTEYMGKQSIDRTKKTRFKKGNIPHNHRLVGEERFTKDGYIEVKVGYPDKWVLKHRLLYDGDIKNDEIIILADGNKTNYEKENLIKISRAENLIMNTNNLRYNNKSFTKSGVLVAKIINKISELK